MSDNPFRSPENSTVRERPVKVKAYGLIPMTRGFYLTLQVVLAVACVAGMFAIRPVVAAPGHTLGFINDNFLLIIIIILGLECVETVMMLAKFKKAEEAQAPRARDDAIQP